MDQRTSAALHLVLVQFKTGPVPLAPHFSEVLLDARYPRNRLTVFPTKAVKTADSLQGEA